MEMEALRRHIGETYTGNCFEPITGLSWNGNTGFQLWKFEADVEFDGAKYRCILITKDVYDSEISSTDVDHAEDVFFDAWKL